MVEQMVEQTEQESVMSGAAQAAPDGVSRMIESVEDGSAMRTLGDAIRVLREGSNKTQQQVAKAAGSVKQPSLSRYERGQSIPSTAEIGLLVQTLVPSKAERERVKASIEQLAQKARGAIDAAAREKRRLRDQHNHVPPPGEPTNLGRNIVRLRTDPDRTGGMLSRAQLAKRAQIHVNHLGQIEHGTVRLPGAATLHKIAKALGVRESELLAEPPAAGPNGATNGHAVNSPIWTQLPGFYYPEQIPSQLQFRRGGDHPRGRLVYDFREATTDATGKPLIAIYTAILE